MENITTQLLENGNLLVTIPISLRSQHTRCRYAPRAAALRLSDYPLRLRLVSAGRKRIIAPEASSDPNESILLALARDRRWQKLIDDNQFTNIKELADTIGKDPSQIARAIRLTRLSPAIIHRIIANDAPDGLSLARLRTNLPEKWDEQETMLMG